jgi:hypothetical protein
MKTICSIHKVLRYKEHVIRAEKRSLFNGMEYSLIIDDVKQDQIYGLYGLLVLHGKLQERDSSMPVKIIMKQRILSTEFFCKVGDELYKMEDFSFDEFK